MATNDDNGIEIPHWLIRRSAERQVSFRVLERLREAMISCSLDHDEAEVLVDLVLSGNGHRGVGWRLDGIYSDGICSAVRMEGVVPPVIQAVVKARGLAFSQTPGRVFTAIHRQRKKQLWWSPRPGEVGWAKAEPLGGSSGAWRLYICSPSQEVKLSARIAYELGLLGKPKWGDDDSRLPESWPHSEKIRFSFLPGEFTLKMARWIVGLIFSAGPPTRGVRDRSSDKWLIENFPDFLAIDERTGYRDPSYMWTINAEAVAQTALVRRPRQSATPEGT
jgi:hypothetical protein